MPSLRTALHRMAQGAPRGALCSGRLQRPKTTACRRPEAAICIVQKQPLPSPRSSYPRRSIAAPYGGDWIRKGTAPLLSGNAIRFVSDFLRHAIGHAQEHKA